MIPRTVLPFSGMLWQTALMSTTSSVHPFAGKIFYCWIRWSIICLRLLPFPNTVCMPPLCRTVSGFSTIRVKSPGTAIITLCGRNGNFSSKSGITSIPMPGSSGTDNTGDDSGYQCYHLHLQYSKRASAADRYRRSVPDAPRKTILMPSVDILIPQSSSHLRYQYPVLQVRRQ